MTYAGARRIADADSHIMEPDREWLRQYASASIAERLEDVPDAVGALTRKAAGPGGFEHLRGEEQIAATLSKKGWDAFGSGEPSERSKVLDVLGFEHQVVFPTFSLFQFLNVEDRELLYGGAEALGRAVADFCSADERLLAVGYLPMAEPRRSLELAKLLVAEGCEAIWIPARVQGDLSPTHREFDPLWSFLEESRIPFVLHVGGDGMALVDRRYHANGIETRRMSGGENVKSKDYFGIAHSAQVLLASMVLDGVLERFPELKGGAIELGALWVVTWLKSLDLVQENFSKLEPALNLPMKASEYVHRQLRFTPFVHEPVGWMIEQSSADLYMFSSDYPHPEGGRNPIRKFEAGMESIGDADRDRFYWRNFHHLFGHPGD